MSTLIPLKSLPPIPLTRLVPCVLLGTIPIPLRHGSWEELGTSVALPLRLPLLHGQSIWIRVVMMTMFMTSFVMMGQILLLMPWPTALVVEARNCPLAARRAWSLRPRWRGPRSNTFLDWRPSVAVGERGGVGVCLWGWLWLRGRPWLRFLWWWWGEAFVCPHSFLRRGSKRGHIDGSFLADFWSLRCVIH